MPCWNAKKSFLWKLSWDSGLLKKWERTVLVLCWSSLGLAKLSAPCPRAIRNLCQAAAIFWLTLFILKWPILFFCICSIKYERFFFMRDNFFHNLWQMQLLWYFYVWIKYSVCRICSMIQSVSLKGGGTISLKMGLKFSLHFRCHWSV